MGDFLKYFLSENLLKLLKNFEKMSNVECVDLWGNKVTFIDTENGINDDENLFFEKVQKKDATVFLIVPNQHKESRLLLSLCQSYAKLKDRTLKIHENDRVWIAFVERRPFSSKKQSFKKWICAAIRHGTTIIVDGVPQVNVKLIEHSELTPCTPPTQK